MTVIDAKGILYREINRQVKAAAQKNNCEITVTNVNGQRYIGAGLTEKVSIFIEGVPGNDLAAFMKGPRIVVSANGQDAIANTMSDGEVIVNGLAGDAVGYAMTGGSVYIKGSAGYRAGVNMKEYRDKVPALVIGNKAGDFLGEYMAGGILIVLGLDAEKGEPVVGNYCGTGMHGGVIYIRGEAEDHRLGREVRCIDMEDKDYKKIEGYIKSFCKYFQKDYSEVLARPFKKLVPSSNRPYGNLYAY